jgi:hypothetical protein
MTAPHIRSGIATARPNHPPPDGEAFRWKAASIAAPQVLADAAVDVTEANWRKCGSCGGGADRSAQRTVSRTPCNARHRLSLAFACGYLNPSRFHFVSMPCWSLRSCAPAHAGDLVLAEDPGPDCDGAEARARQSFPTTTERRVTRKR